MLRDLRGLAVGITSLLSAMLPQVVFAQADTAKQPDYVAVVRTFADNVLKYGRDTYGERHTPLFVDGINVDTHDPATWVLPDDCAEVWKMPKRQVMSNLASQQVLFRTLVSLSAITGDPRYHQAALDATRYMLEHYRWRDGLLFWGGHCMIDAGADRFVGESNKDWSKGVPVPATWDTGVMHELKYHFPYYELMWEADPEAFKQFVLAFWASHTQNWRNLDMNRHGVYGWHVGQTWDAIYEGGPLPFEGHGAPFIHTGSDMMYAAGLLTEFTGDRRPLAWANRMASRYDQIRNVKTGLSADMYHYYHNERVLAVFSPEWGDRVTETTIASYYGGRYGPSAVTLLKFARRIGSGADPIRDFVLRDLAAFARHSYDPATNGFRTMLIDGTPLRPEDAKRPGSITPESLEDHGAGTMALWAYVQGGLNSDEPVIWETARHIARANQVGELGITPGQGPKLNLATESADTNILFAMLDLYTATKQRAYLNMADRIGTNIVAKRFHHGFFLPDASHLMAKFDEAEPFALLHLHAALSGKDLKLAPYYASQSYFHNDYEGKGRTYDGNEVFSLRR